MSSTGSSSPRRGNTGGKEDRPRFFGTTVKAKCWSNAQVVPGRHPERWRTDAAGNIVCKRFCNCQGCLCFEYDHILPFSKGMSGLLPFGAVYVPSSSQSKAPTSLQATPAPTPQSTKQAPFENQPHIFKHKKRTNEPNPVDAGQKRQKGSQSVGNLFGKLAIANVSEADVKGWDNLSPRSAEVSAKRATAELFYYTFMRSREAQSSSARIKELEKENTNLSLQAKKHKDEMNKLSKDLAHERSEVKRLDNELKTQAEVARLQKEETDNELASLRMEKEGFGPDLTKAKEDGYTEGSLDCVKQILSYLPKFDWTPFGKSTVEYMVDFKKNNFEEIEAIIEERAEKERAELEKKASNDKIA